MTPNNATIAPKAVSEQITNDHSKGTAITEVDAFRWTVATVPDSKLFKNSTEFSN